MLEIDKNKSVDDTRKQLTKTPSIAKNFLKSNAKVKTYTGLPSQQSFEDLYQYLFKHAKKISYWKGVKKTISTKVQKKFKKSPDKIGPKRKLSIKDELLLTLVKLRHAPRNQMLADIFGISVGVASQIFNTWIKFMAHELRPLIYWPPEELVYQTKRIANARIHVERAIGRLKNFTILKTVLPITLLPLADDIIVVCACICNLLSPLVF